MLPSTRNACSSEQLTLTEGASPVCRRPRDQQKPAELVSSARGLEPVFLLGCKRGQSLAARAPAASGGETRPPFMGTSCVRSDETNKKKNKKIKKLEKGGERKKEGKIREEWSMHIDAAALRNASAT